MNTKYVKEQKSFNTLAKKSRIIFCDWKWNIYTCEVYSFLRTGQQRNIKSAGKSTAWKNNDVVLHGADRAAFFFSREKRMFTSCFHCRSKFPLVSLAASGFSTPIRHHPHPLHFGLGSLGRRWKATGTLLWAWRGFGGGHRLTSGAAGVIYCKQAHRQWLPRTAGVVEGRPTQDSSGSSGLSSAAVLTQSKENTFSRGLNFHEVNVDIQLSPQWLDISTEKQVLKVNYFFISIL